MNSFDHEIRRPVWAIILGAIRNREEFDSLYQWATDAKRRGILDGVVFVSWLGQYSNDEELINRIKADGHRLLELEEPMITIPNYGHIFHQMKALHYGLHSCPPDALVLKIRTDKYGSVEDLENLMSERQLPVCDLSLGWPAIFNYRIYVRCASILNPFFINDIVYYGQRQDLLKLVNFDLRYLEVFRRMIPEQWFHSNPFLEHFPIFQDYFCMQPTLGVGGLPGTYRFVDLLKHEPWLMAVMTTYHEILHRYFILGDTDRASMNYKPAPPTRQFDFTAIFHDTIPELAVYRHPAGQWPFASSHRWLDAVEQEAYMPGELWNHYSAARSLIRSIDFHRQYQPCPLLHGELLRINRLIEDKVCQEPASQ